MQITLGWLKNRDNLIGFSNSTLFLQEAIVKIPLFFVFSEKIFIKMCTLYKWPYWESTFLKKCAIHSKTIVVKLIDKFLQRNGSCPLKKNLLYLLQKHEENEPCKKACHIKFSDLA